MGIPALYSPKLKHALFYGCVRIWGQIMRTSTLSPVEGCWFIGMMFLYPTHVNFPSCEADMSPVPRDAEPNPKGCRAYSLGKFTCGY
jgi:hypothetical protein